MEKIKSLRNMIDWGLEQQQKENSKVDGKNT